MNATCQLKLIALATRFFSLLVFGAACMAAHAQNTGGIEFIPAQPTSADTIYVKVPRVCSNARLSSYQTSYTTANKLRVEAFTFPVNGCDNRDAVAAPLMIELGKLPAGTYSVEAFEYRAISFEFTILLLAKDLSLVVTDHQVAKPAPAVFIDYSDHWWDASDPGSGLFIWQNRTDQVLAAWFTYGTTGQPMWYTIQAGTWVSPTRYEGKLIQSGRSTSPSPPILLVAQEVGTAVLDFTGDDSALSGRFTYKFDSAISQVTRNIRRFGK